MRIFFLLLIAVSMTTCSVAQNRLPKESLQKIDQLFEQLNETTPGYAIGVIKDSSWLLNKGYGSANLEYQIPITSQSVFNIASLSKQFTAACIAQLILEGKLSLEDKANKYLSDFPAYAEEVRIKHLVYMSSGIKEYYQCPRANGTDWTSLNFFNIDTAIIASLSQPELEYAPGTKWTYSNINYMLLTRIVENISGQAFSTYAEEHLFKPLGMTSTMVNDDIFQVIPNRVSGYNKRTAESNQECIDYGYLRVAKEGYFQVYRNSPHFGGSGVYTSLEDLKKWALNFQSQSLGGAAFYELMHKTMKLDHDKSNDAFGLVFGDFNGHEIIWYEGGDWGFSAYMMRFPKDQLTVICLSNLGSGNARSFANRVLDILIEDQLVKLH